MKKNKHYKLTKFSTDVIKKSLEKLRGLAGDQEIEFFHMSAKLNGEEWSHDNFEEFLSDYRNSDEALFWVQTKNYSHQISINFIYKETSVTVKSPDRSGIQALFEVFEENLVNSKIIEEKKDEDEKQKGRGITIFIGHGREGQWRELKDHLQDQHGMQIEAYETGSRAGHTIRDILRSMIERSSFAILVLSAEDEQIDGTYNPRLNVVHETGLFQGKLGFDRAIVLLEEGANNFTNLDGIQQIRFSKGRIKETFGDVLATIKREFGKLVIR